MTRRFRRYSHQAALLVVLCGVTFAVLSDHQATRMTGAHARFVMNAALAHAREHEAPGGAIAIVDDGGHVALFERLDGTFAAAVDVSIGKARTAALFKKPTRVFEDAVNGGRFTMVGLSSIVGFTPLKGGVPLVVDGQIVGAIGVSGAASADQDDEIAVAASEALGRHGAELGAVVHLDSDSVAAAFNRGAPLYETTGFKVHASRRDQPGEAEIHLTDADIFYVQKGAATFITGGELVKPRTVAAGEMRGESISGGRETKLNTGDVVVIPEGVPHWFKSVTTPFEYYVVKSVR